MKTALLHFLTATIFLLFSLFSFSQPSVVISQIYGGGGNASASYSHDYVELFNPTASGINLNGWSIQYCNATGTTWTVAPLAGTIAAGHYYLIQLHTAGSSGAALPTPEASGTANISTSGGKVILSTSTTALSGSCPSGVAIIDMVGYGSTATCYEGSPALSPGSNVKSLFRMNGGCFDGNNNATDFIVNATLPRNGASPLNDCTSGIAEAGPHYIKVFPNPCQSLLTVANHSGLLQIENNAGQTIMQLTLTDAPVDVSDLEQGIYHIMLYEGTKKYYSQFIKQ